MTAMTEKEENLTEILLALMARLGVESLEFGDDELDAVMDRKLAFVEDGGGANLTVTMIPEWVKLEPTTPMGKAVETLREPIVVNAKTAEQTKEAWRRVEEMLKRPPAATPVTYTTNSSGGGSLIPDSFDPVRFAGSTPRHMLEYWKEAMKAPIEKP